MPCSDGGSPNLQGFGGPYPEAVARSDKLARLLCFVMGKLDGTIRGCLFSGGEPEAEELSDWWEAHQTLDLERKIAERVAANRAAIRKRAIAKLTPAERRALDLK